MKFQHVTGIYGGVRASFQWVSEGSFKGVTFILWPKGWVGLILAPLLRKTGLRESCWQLVRLSLAGTSWWLWKCGGDSWFEMYCGDKVGSAAAVWVREDETMNQFRGRQPGFERRLEREILVMDSVGRVELRIISSFLAQYLGQIEAWWSINGEGQGADDGFSLRMYLSCQWHIKRDMSNREAKLGLGMVACRSQRRRVNEFNQNVGKIWQNHIWARQWNWPCGTKHEGESETIMLVN